MLENTNVENLNDLTKENFSIFNNTEIETKLEYKIEEQNEVLRKFKQLLEIEGISNEKIKKYYEIVENNIKDLTQKKEELNKINNSLTGLLVNAEEKQDEDEISEKFNFIKQSITGYYNQLDQSISNIDETNIEIMKFLNEANENSIENEEAHIEITEETAIPENDTLTISEKLEKVFLPYTKTELSEYVRQYPNKYSSFETIINQEFVYPLAYYNRYPSLARFREMYSLVHDREGKNVLEALKKGFEFMLKNQLNPAIIAACKTEQQLANYLESIETGNTDTFKDFKIVFDFRPAKIIL